MNSSETSEVSSDHEMVVKIKGGKYIFSIPELGIVASGKDWESGYQALILKTESVEASLKNLPGRDLEPPVSKTEKKATANEALNNKMTGGGIVSFVLKTVVILAAVLFVLNLAGNRLDRILNNNVNNLSTQLASNVNNLSTQLAINVNNLSTQLASNVNNLSSKVDNTLDNARRELSGGVATLTTLLPSHPGRVLEQELYRAVDHPIDPERQEKIIKSIRVVASRLEPFINEIRPLFADKDRPAAKGK